MAQPASYVMNYVHNVLIAQAKIVLLVEMEPLSTITSALDAIKHVKHAQLGI